MAIPTADITPRAWLRVIRRSLLNGSEAQWIRLTILQRDLDQAPMIAVLDLHHIDAETSTYVSNERILSTKLSAFAFQDEILRLSSFCEEIPFAEYHRIAMERLATLVATGPGPARARSRNGRVDRASPSFAPVAFALPAATPAFRSPSGRNRSEVSPFALSPLPT
jgi:hypothetical protein